MIDITELAQSLKAAAEKATPGQWERGDGKHGGELLVYCDDALGSAVCEAISVYNAIPKYQRIDNLDFIAMANPANILSLVEALESEKRICATWRKTATAVSEKLEKAQQCITELKSGKVGNALLERENHHVEVVGKLTERIAELESRTVTVKLPKLKMLEDYLAEVAIEERKQILVGVKLEFHRALAAAGIKWEAE
ncbi:ead/Ea22-like family protein [Klebsiella quasipneumoniae]|uniref:ead/Ea22-like family protein n=1 Tax=Klebsiella quasipneumoniae TaxID=1463165 RepID=UPI000D6FD4A0|nr:ead/Ea22-like family protein [Klebsiella quasipneumoniae]